MAQLRAYCPIFNPPQTNDTRAYTKIYLGSQLDSDDLQSQCLYDMKDAGIGFYRKEVQSDVSSEIYWLLYSSRQAHNKDIVKEVYDHTGV